MQSGNVPDQIEFDRPKKYETVEVLGRGACGQTVHIRDSDMDVNLVVKKYCPIVSKSAQPKFFQELIDRFRDEARILFQLNHPNIVRVYNFFDYADQDTAYIIMEHVSGTDIVAYIKDNPLNFDHVFERTLSGFEHLESKDVLHRDIRPLNILVTEHGDPKIIDFGFGKQNRPEESSYEKSISLEWWCDPPSDFNDGIYDAQTEVYFVGKLFEFIIAEAKLYGSKYTQIVKRMCALSRSDRLLCFADAMLALNETRFNEIEFSIPEKLAYREFVDELFGVFISIQSSSTYKKDSEMIIEELEILYKSSMLEQFVPDPSKVSRVFVQGSYTYSKRSVVTVSKLDAFLRLLKGLTGSKREIVLANVFGKLDAIDRTFPDLNLDDEIPF